MIASLIGIKCTETLRLRRTPLRSLRGLRFTIPFIDLTPRPPRSARVRLGGPAILPRMLDKGRAVIVGKQGDFKYACPLIQEFLNFAGVDPEKLREQLTAGKTNSQILEWIKANPNKKARSLRN